MLYRRKGALFRVQWTRSKDGRFILYQLAGANTGQDLWIAPQSGDRKPFPYLLTQFDEQEGRFSPHGNWVAYVSNESGRDEIYVQAFPPSGAKFQISTGGRSQPQWRMDGTELFYLATDQMLMTVPVKLGRSGSESFQAGLPKPLMTVPLVATAGIGVGSYAVSNDGQRFLIPTVAGGVRAARHSGAQLAGGAEEMTFPVLGAYVSWDSACKVGFAESGNRSNPLSRSF